MNARMIEKCRAILDTKTGGRLEPEWETGFIYQRTRETVAGNVVYVECFPVWNTGASSRGSRDAVEDARKKEAHREAQKRMDVKNAEKRLIRKINANFGDGDIFITLEYAPGKVPSDTEQAKRDIQNYLRRVKTMREKRSLSECRYIYVTEETQSRKYGPRIHHHLLISGNGVTREEMEALWTKKKGGLCNSRYTKTNRSGLAGLACYLVKDKSKRAMIENGKNPQKHIGRRWNCSKNLIEPVISVSDHRISMKQAAQFEAAMLENAEVVLMGLYPDYELIECKVKRSEWAAGVYIYAELRKTKTCWRRNDEDMEHNKRRWSGRTPAASPLHNGKREQKNNSSVAQCEVKSKGLQEKFL